MVEWAHMCGLNVNRHKIKSRRKNIMFAKASLLFTLKQKKPC
jgi:hypothetical protein